MSKLLWLRREFTFYFTFLRNSLRLILVNHRFCGDIISAAFIIGELYMLVIDNPPNPLDYIIGNNRGRQRYQTRVKSLKSARLRLMKHLLRHYL